jgi:dUTP pyrophosphatase
LLLYFYLGEIKILCINSTDEPYEIKMHDRIAQLIVECIKNFELNVVSELCETERGGKGFGSSGV